MSVTVQYQELPVDRTTVEDGATITNSTIEKVVIEEATDKQILESIRHFTRLGDDVVVTLKQKPSKG